MYSSPIDRLRRNSVDLPSRVAGRSGGAVSERVGETGRATAAIAKPGDPRLQGVGRVNFGHLLLRFRQLLPAAPGQLPHDCVERPSCRAVPPMLPGILATLRRSCCLAAVHPKPPVRQCRRPAQAPAPRPGTASWPQVHSQLVLHGLVCRFSAAPLYSRCQQSPAHDRADPGDPAVPSDAIAASAKIRRRPGDAVEPAGRRGNTVSRPPAKTRWPRPGGLDPAAWTRRPRQCVCRAGPTGWSR